MAKDAWTKGYQKAQAEYLAQLRREANTGSNESGSNQAKPDKTQK